MPFAAIAISATLAPRIEIYTMLVCSVHKPDIFRQAYPPGSYQHSQAAPILVQRSRSPEPMVSRLPTPLAHATESVVLRFDEGKLSEWGWVGEDTGGNTCASDPVVQAEVAKLTLGKFVVPFSSSLHVANIAYQRFCVLASKEC